MAFGSSPCIKHFQSCGLFGRGHPTLRSLPPCLTLAAASHVLDFAKSLEMDRGKERQNSKKGGKTKVWSTGKKARKRVLCSWHCHKCQRAHQTCHKRDPRRFIPEAFQGLGPEKSFCSTLAYQSCKVKMRTRFHQAPAAT